MTMIARWRKSMLFAGITLLAVGLILLGYLYWPLPHRQVIETAPATFFVLPP